jgi:hypothetical protein
VENAFKYPEFCCLLDVTVTVHYQHFRLCCKINLGGFIYLGFQKFWVALVTFVVLLKLQKLLITTIAFTVFSFAGIFPNNLGCCYSVPDLALAATTRTFSFSFKNAWKLLTSLDTSV